MIEKIIIVFNQICELEGTVNNLNKKEVLESLKKVISEEKIKQNEQMKEHTSFKIGGPAEIYIKPSNIEEMKEILNIAKNNEIPLTIIGNGSNLLVMETGIKGIVLKIDMKEIKIKDLKEKVEVTVDAGVPLCLLAQKLLKEEITGFEELSGIPRNNRRGNCNECRSIWKRNERYSYRSNSIRL